jgi:phosphoenolpyruvate synthase/pyruvate phosphate dikinase
MIFYIQDIDSKNQNLVGNKAFNLSILHKNNFKIPRGFILTTEIFDDFTTSKKISNFENIKEKFVEQFGQNSRVIVRSSANFEDREDASFAGIYESYLNVGLEELEEKIELVFNSIFSEKALAYYKNNNIPKEKVKMAVIIQEQIKPLISGVCFTKNPINHRDEYIIEYVTGSNDKFVSGFETPNNLIFNQDFSLQSKVEDSLYLEIIKDSLDKFKHIEELFGKPQDVEWAIDNNKELFILQARDIVFEKEVIDEINHQKPIAHGVAMSSGIGRGNLKFINSNLNFEDLKNSISNKDVIMAHNLRVDQILAIQNAAGIILTEASILSHVAIQAREFKIPCVGGIYERNLFTEGQEITINGSTGAIYEGITNANFTENTLLNKFPNYINLDLVKEYQAEGIHFLYCIVENEAMIYLPRVGDKKLEEQACEILNLEFKISPENIHINQIKVYEKEIAASSIYSYFQDYKQMLADPELALILEECLRYLENIDL